MGNKDFKLQDFLCEALNCPDELWEEFHVCYEVDISEVYTFEDFGLLTSDAGLVVKMSNGEEFQITIVQRK